MAVVTIVREILLNLMVLTAMVFAWRNLRLGRGDQMTALRFAVYLGMVRLLWIVGAHHVAAPDEALILVAHYAYSTWRVFLVLVFYLAVAIVSLLSISVYPVAYSSFPLHAATLLVFTAAYFFTLFRFGFLALVTAASVSTMFVTMPFTPDPTSWIFGGTLVVIAIALGVAFYGLRAALAGRPILGGGNGP